MPDLEAARRFLRDSDLVVDAATVDAAIVRVGTEVSAACSEDYPLLLTVMGGAVMFAGRLLPLLRFPLDIDYLHATRYGDATKGGGLEWKVLPPAGVKGRHVLVLDDILDAGHTLKAIRDRLLEAGATSVRCAVLVEKILPAAKPIAAEFVGLRIPDRFVFGCGMDAKGYWRNLPEIRAIKE